MACIGIVWKRAWLARRLFLRNTRQCACLGDPWFKRKEWKTLSSVRNSVSRQS